MLQRVGRHSQFPPARSLDHLQNELPPFDGHPVLLV